MVIKQSILNEDYDAPSVSDVERFLQRSVRTLLHSEYTICKFGLRHPSLDIMVGWSDGYDINDKSVIHDDISPSFGINAGIKVHTSDMGPDFDFYNSPYEANGDVLDTSCGIAPNENYNALAKYLISEYNEMKNLDMDYDGKIISDSKDDEVEEIEESIASKEEVENKYKAAYGKDLDWKSVPAVKFADKFLSGWGEAEGRIHTQVLLCANSVEAANLEYYISNNRKELMAGRIRRTFGVKFNPSMESYIIAADAPALGGTKDYVVKEEPKAKEDAPVEEAYIDTEDDSIKSYKYKDQTVYRIIATRMEGDRTQMFTIGTGTKLDDTEFEPVVRSARYTTEESFLWLDSVKAEKFLRRFKREYPDVDMSKMHVAEYNPLYPIIKLVPITSPCGRAYLGVQDIPKEKLDAKKEDEKKTESLENANLSEGADEAPNGVIAADIYNAILEYDEAKYKPILDMKKVNTVSSRIEKVLNANGGIAGHDAQAHIQVSGKRYTMRVFIRLVAKENNESFKIILNGACLFDDEKNPNINDKVTDYEQNLLGLETQKYIIFGPWDRSLSDFNPDPYVDKSHGPTVYDSFNAFDKGGEFDRDFKIQVLHKPYFLAKNIQTELISTLVDMIDTKASEDVDDGIEATDLEEFKNFFNSCMQSLKDEYGDDIRMPLDIEDAYSVYIKRYKYWNY